MNASRVMVWVLALLLAGCYVPESAETRTKRAAVHLVMVGGNTCSGTMVGPSLLLSAAHCFEGDRLLTVNGTPVNVLSYRHDGADHALLVLDIAVIDHVPMVFVDAEQGSAVFMHGNPGIPSLMRRGYVAGQDERFILLDMSVSGGDSGAGVFNERGEFIGVLSAYATAHSGMRLALVKPITLPPAMWPLVLED